MLIFGVGVFDEKAGPDNKVPRAYWSGILRRCYSEEPIGQAYCAVVTVKSLWSDGPLIEGPLYARNGTHSLHSNSGFSLTTKKAGTWTKTCWPMIAKYTAQPLAYSSRNG